MRSAKILYIAVSVLYFPIGTVLAWYSYREVKRFEKRCLYDKALRKIQNDGIMMVGLIAAWIVACLLTTNSFVDVPDW
jgi:hypothetical protein